MVRSRAPRKLVANIVAGTGAQAATALAALWAVPQILGSIGAAGYGVYSLAGALLGYFSIADLGMSNATIQRLGRARAESDPVAFNRTVATSAALLGSIGVVLAVGLFLVSRPVADLLAGSTASERQLRAMEDATRLCALGALPAMLRPVAEAIFAASERLVVIYSISTVANLTRTVGAVVALHFHDEIATPVAVMVGATTLQCLILCVVALVSTVEFRQAPVRVSFDELRQLFKISIPVWLTTGTGMIANQLDKIVVAAMCGLATAGRYAVAFEVASRLWMLPYIVGRAYFARFSSQLVHVEPSTCELDIRRFAVVSLGAAIVPAVALGVYARPFLQAYTGQQDLQEAPTVLVLLLIGVAGNVASYAAFVVLQLKLHLKALAVPHVAFLVIHGVGCLVLTRRYGAVGAALSWSISILLLWAALQVALARRYTLGFARDLLRLVAGGICAALALTLFSSRLAPLPMWADGGLFVRLAPVLFRLALSAGFIVMVLALALVAGNAGWFTMMAKRTK